MSVWTTSHASGSCQINDPSGNYVDWDTNVTSNTTVNGYELAANFNPDTTGTYTIYCTADYLMFSYKIAPTLSVGGLVGGIVGGVLLAVFGFIIGLIVLIVTIVRRSNWNRKYGKGAMQYPGQYPGQYPQQMPGQYPQQLPGQYPPTGAPWAGQQYPPQQAPNQYPPQPLNQYPPQAAAQYPPAGQWGPPAAPQYPTTPPASPSSPPPSDLATPSSSADTILNPFTRPPENPSAT